MLAVMRHFYDPQQSPFFFILILGIAFSLTGCATHSYRTTDASVLNSPYSHTTANVLRDLLIFELSDDSPGKTDFRKVRLVEALLITKAGKTINLGTPKGNFSARGARYEFDLKQADFSGRAFDLRFTFNIEGRKVVISGTFSIHDHFNIITIFDVMEALG